MTSWPLTRVRLVCPVSTVFRCSCNRLDELFLLGVHRYDWLHRRRCARRLGVDVVELGVPVGMGGALARLAVPGG